jgi:hypothetical protein
MDHTAKYTLEEAAQIFRQRECQRSGHDFSHILTGMSRDPVKIVCDRCGKTWKVINE